MLSNWRSSLMFSKLAFRQDDNLIAILAAKDVYKQVEYIVLDAGRLHGQSTLTWAKNHFGEFGFDFDKYSMLLWPDNDAVVASTIVQQINNVVPKFASIKMIPPALAHGLDEVAALTFDDGSFEIDDPSTNPDINLYF
jgi:hypothetical protein